MKTLAEIGALIDRCERLCGSGPDGCFVENRKQLNCIADMVVNKIAGVREILRTSRDDAPNEEARQVLELAVRSLEELVEWVEYLHVVQDLKTLRKLGRTPDSRRREDRYPLPETFRDYVLMRVEGPGGIERVQLLDFSRRGVRFKTGVLLKAGDRYPCFLSIPPNMMGDVTFRVAVRHVEKQADENIVGASVEDVGDEKGFAVFKKLFDYLIDRVEPAKGRKDTRFKDN